MKITSKLLLLVALLLTTITHAQKSEVGNWINYFGNQKIDSRWNWHNEVQYRNYNFAGDLEQLLIRTGFGYNLTENNNNILLGYGFIHSEVYIDATDEKFDVKEHRIFEQFITKQQFGSVYIQHRYRFEQRFIEDNFKMRVRYFLGVNIPLNKKQMGKNAIYASAYNEIFINTEGNYFDRDRIYGGIGYNFTKDIKVELGVMTQVMQNNSRTQFQIMIFNNLPF